MKKGFFRIVGQQEGQTVLIVMLMAMVILTIGLSVVSRSVTDVRISAQSQESARAFWVAQGVLENALRASAGGSGTTGDISYEVSKVNFGGGENFIFPDLIFVNSPVLFWLVGHDNNGEIDSSDYYQENSLNIYWGNEGTLPDSESTPALLATLIYQTTLGSYYSRQFAFDAYTGRTAKTNFSEPSVGSFEIGGKKFVFKGTISFAGLPSFSKPYYLNLELLFNDANQAVGIEAVSGQDFPPQGNCYGSSATITASNIVRKLNECQEWETPLEIFNYLLYSGSGLEK